MKQFYESSIDRQSDRDATDPGERVTNKSIYRSKRSNKTIVRRTRVKIGELVLKCSWNSWSWRTGKPTPRRKGRGFIYVFVYVYSQILKPAQNYEMWILIWDNVAYKQ